MKKDLCRLSGVVPSRTLGRDNSIHVQLRSNLMLILAIHGGGIETGTSELSQAIAGTDLRRNP
jgi:phage replication-related protein YjqB (UPF0714/DUF867 family)